MMDSVQLQRTSGMSSGRELKGAEVAPRCLPQTASAESGPEVHVLDARGGLFCLDVNSSAIFAVDEITAEVLKANPATAEEACARLTPRFSAELVLDAFEVVQDLRSRGYFCPCSKLARFRALPIPDRLSLIGLSLHVIARCNLNCVYCFNDGGAADEALLPRMTPSVARRAVDFLLEHSEDDVGVSFFGGEPLLNFALIKEVVSYCETLGRPFKYALITNGTVLTHEIADFLEQRRFHVVVSYDGYLQDEQRPACGGRSTRELIRSNIRELVKRLPRHDLAIRTVITHKTTDFAALASEAEELGIRLTVGPVTICSGHPLDITPEDLQALLDFETGYLTRSLDVGDLDRLTGLSCVANTLRRAYTGQQRYYSCGVGKDIVGVSLEGDIYPCHRFVGIEQFKMGSVWDGVDPAALETYHNLFVDMKEDCRGCWARYFCGGGCAHDAYTAQGDLTRTPVSRCDVMRQEIELGLKLFVQLANERPELLEALTRDG